MPIYIYYAFVPSLALRLHVVRTRKALDLRGFQNSPDLRARFGSFNRIIQSHGEPLARLLRCPTPPGHLPIPITGATPKALGSSLSPSDYPMNQH